MSWFVAIAENARQRQAVELLHERDFPAYAPTFLKTIVRNGRKVEVSRFLFGQYFFVMMREGWEAIMSMRFVRQILLGPKLQPMLLGDAAIEQIKAREVVGAVRLNEGLVRGQRVTPRVGHLQGVEGRFLCERSQRDVALFNILGEETPVEFAPGVLEVLDPIAVAVERKRRRRNRATTG